MHIIMKWSTYGISGFLLFALAGCGTGEAPAEKKSEGGLMPVAKNAKQLLGEQRMAAATKGLSFGSGRVTVTVRRPSDRASALRAYEVAVKSLDIENSWFVCAGKFRDAILLDPTYAPSYEGLARAFLLDGKVDLAEASLKTALAYQPQFSKAEFGLGMVRQMNGEYAEAVEVWKGLVKHDPAYPDAYARMAIASYFDQDYKSAWTYLGEADKRKQNVPPQFRGLLKEVAPRP